MTPKCAPLETVLLVPVRGPSSASGAVISVPSASPSARAVTVLHQPSPNVIGSQPKTITENARFPPKNTAARFAGRESRSASGMYATPASSIRPARSTTAGLSVRDRRHDAAEYVRLKIQSRLAHGDSAPARAMAPDRRNLILDAAIGVIARTGVRGLRVEVVAAEAGVAVSLIYYYFGSRKGLVRATLDHANERAASAAPAGVRATLLAELDEAAARDRRPSGARSRRRAVFDPDLRDQVSEATEAWVALVARAIAAEAPHKDASAAAERLTALVDGLSSRWLAGALDRERARELLDAAITVGAGMTPRSSASSSRRRAPQPEAVVELAVLADQVGLDLVTFQDHPYQPSCSTPGRCCRTSRPARRRVRLAPNVLNLPLRPPAVLARAVAAPRPAQRRAGRARARRRRRSGTRSRRWAGRRLTPGQGVDALEEAIDVIRALWDVDAGRRVHARRRALPRSSAPRRGPAPRHDVGIWIGAYKPRMLALTGRKGDGWLPSLAYLQPGDLAAGNAAIDEAARRRGPRPVGDPPAAEPAACPTMTGRRVHARSRCEDGVGTFIVMADDPAIELPRIAPAVRPCGRTAAAPSRVRGRRGTGRRPTAAAAEDAPRRHADPRRRHAPQRRAPWDESTRPHRPAGRRGRYSARGRAVGQHLIDVHDMLRRELTELREHRSPRCATGALTAGRRRARR